MELPEPTRRPPSRGPTREPSHHLVRQALLRAQVSAPPPTLPTGLSYNLRGTWRKTTNGLPSSPRTSTASMNEPGVPTSSSSTVRSCAAAVRPSCPVEPYYDETVPAPGGPLPTCRCGDLLRPDVVLFAPARPSRPTARRNGSSVTPRCCSSSALRARSSRPPALWVGSGVGRRLRPCERRARDDPDPDIDAELIGPAEVVLPALVATVRAEPGP